MVFYECLITTKNTAHFNALTSLVKQVAHTVVEGGGIVRSVQNHGIRQFPQKYKAKYPDFVTGQRAFDKGRFFSIYYDANPRTQKDVDILLSRDDQVLRRTHLKARSKMDFITIQRPDRNPYVQAVLEQEAADELADVEVEGNETIDAAQQQQQLK
uniref:Ribosomal protein S6 n=1 Tax=Craspedostauros australis TaxID=1486917 RepID=A0A7R9ZLT6_9STRA|mmetsp:Transcript_15245/g.42176  ORF Transcript_15245/g.42176 Transcript_15245/m.42176 type:complete len:156 (+) Transcript_15245:220-687(+)|eukprot:CAMPEP_0198133148 /NCGR_PEP_ID=MMETSP1442-20131203/59413_1 /TAXON_ID= /ORGANISM="Craspedostauros australis, Strain CCMP3328" /LENGTH=155 /DNA_ID=CAMNT_0043794255 /DNA_START=897 /DNA_END=1364 /DNA_ORIENTATION=+